MEISTWKLKMYRIDSSKHCTENKFNTMIAMPRTQKHSSSSSNEPSDIAVTVNQNPDINLIAVKPII
jgi:hypothetical protein